MSYNLIVIAIMLIHLKVPTSEYTLITIKLISLNIKRFTIYLHTLRQYLIMACHRLDT